MAIVYAGATNELKIICPKCGLEKKQMYLNLKILIKG